MPAARARSRTEEAKPKPRADAYVGLLGLSLLALFAAMLFAYLNWADIKEKPKAVPTSPPGGGAARAPVAPGPNLAAPQPGQGKAPAPVAPGGKAPTPPQKK